MYQPKNTPPGPGPSHRKASQPHNHNLISIVKTNISFCATTEKLSIRFYIEVKRGSYVLPPALTSRQQTEPEGPGGKKLHKLQVLQVTVELQVQS